MSLTTSSAGRHFAGLLRRLDPAAPEELLQHAARLVSAGENGALCLDLNKLLMSTTAAEALRSSFLVGRPGEARPLILDADGRLYLYRAYTAENALAVQLKKRAGQRRRLDPARIESALRRLFADEPDGEQARAARLALESPLTVICGGPGTGKTTTVVRILALLLELCGPQRLLLAAPTGKAAARLRDAVNRARAALATDPSVLKQIPTEAATLHRLLEATGRPGGYRRNRQRELAADLVVVDEASMIDLDLMQGLLDALPESAGLILLGDPDQLASVEPGAILADLMTAAALPGPLSGHVATLQKSRRFADGGGIGSLCAAIRCGRSDLVLPLLQDDAALVHRPLQPAHQLAALLAGEIAGLLARVLAAADLRTAMTIASESMILSALRQGPYGSLALNAAIEEILQKRGLIPATLWYPGRPILIVRNAPAVGLFNGDLGLVWPHPETGELAVAFPDGAGEIRFVASAHLPEHETAFVMTVHKSQGSEFDRIDLILPPVDSALLTRELLYTAVSRTRRHFCLYGDAAVLSAGLGRKTERPSGLCARLVSGIDPD